MIRPLHRGYRRLRYGKPIVVVSGLPRSGTSMVMKMIEAGGLELVHDGVRQPDEDNPTGYYEDQRVMALCTDADRTWLSEARGKAVKVISHLLKELPACNNYRVIFVRRPIDEVLASQAKMLARRGQRADIPDERMRELFEADLWRSSYTLKHSAHFEHIEVDYRSLLDKPLEEAELIKGFVGENLDARKMTAVVDRSLYRNRLPADGPSAAIDMAHR